ncbi:MAG: sterol desaturase family protein [Lysobacteraceae bacterium]
MKERSLKTLFDDAVDPLARMAATRANAHASTVADVSISLLLLVEGARRSDIHTAAVILTITAGLLLYSFIEYCFHRWLFHGGPIQVLEEGHAQHHVDPLGYDALPFFLPPIALLVLAGLFALMMPTSYALLLAGAIGMGYATYGIVHSIMHLRRFTHALSRRWAASHHIHHHHPGHNFGVTTSLWDYVLGTRYSSRSKR